MLILFDIDETLADHGRAFRAATLALHALAGSAAPPDEFAAQWSGVHQRNFDRFLRGELTYEQQGRARVRETVDAGLSDAHADRLFAAYVAAYEAGWSLFDDTLPCLDRLADHKLGVISNGQTKQQRKKLERLQIVQRFDYVLISQECGWPKPDARIFQRACSAAGESPQNAVYVGDLYDVDAAGARRAGLTGVWLDRARTGSAEHAAPVIASLRELPALIDSLAAGRGNRSQ